MIIYEAKKNGVIVNINKDLLKKFLLLGYEIYQIDTENNQKNKLSQQEIELLKGEH